mmetsp:Transcript_8556/g.13554  ORF Transcript_8556/g.13554 Transcript_8556/m.13554 type:complete len:239 (+) Transcript_8556:134-850(+)
MYSNSLTPLTFYSVSFIDGKLVTTKMGVGNKRKRENCMTIEETTRRKRMLLQMMEKWCEVDDEEFNKCSLPYFLLQKPISESEVLQQRDDSIVEIQTNTRFRMQYALSRTVGPSHQFQVANVHPQVWTSLKKFLSDHTPPTDITELKNYLKLDNGRIRYTVEKLRYERNQCIILPTLKKDSWWLKKFESNGNKMQARIEHFSLSYNEYTRNVRVEMIYSVYKLINFYGNDKWIRSDNA